MKTKVSAAVVVYFGLVCISIALGAEKSKYPPPRFPSYVRPPKSLDDVLPFARAAVRQTGGRTPLGLVEKGMTEAIFIESTAEDIIMEAANPAYDEHGVNVHIIAMH